MKSSTTLVYAGLATAGLIAAFVTWQRPKETSTQAKVTVVDATKKSLERVRYEDGTRFVELTREGEETFFVTQGFLPGKEPVSDAGRPDAGKTPDAGATQPDAGPSEEEEPLEEHDEEPEAQVTPPTAYVPTRTMKAGERAKELFAKLTPFEATRALGTMSDEKLKEVGLADSKYRLTLTVAGTERVFTVAKPMSGLFGWYVRDEGSKQVYLLEGSLLTDLEPGSQVLIDRRLHAFKLNEFDSFVITTEGKSATFTHSAPDNIPQTVKIARAETPDTPEELVKNWHEKVFGRLIVTEVFGKGEAPKGEEPKVSLRVDYKHKGKDKGWLELGVDKNNVMYARSENTAGWVGIHQGSDQLVLEAQKFVGAAPKK